ncbi:ABC transporter substrate-binding protein [Sinorhizobium sp. BG8]|uniref:ABC transporter substrate-binding protein n=1 Tax=Sinorhizobium sp. BG8 TaxID=2613773 RepID=UPI00193DDD76|nr:ABC transporter substrate-binding protein [Sinorhizobium sp. BG8]QRM55923.1 amino acid ABC transporter substrate-binding protein [Sinorhizobium sp. BG8]
MRIFSGVPASAAGQLRRIVMLALCHLFLVTLLHSPAGAATALDRIKQKGTLTVAVFFEDVPPFFYKDASGALAGIDPSLAEDIARKLGVTVTYNRNAETFDGVIDEVVSGRADIAISLLSDTLERAMRANFTTSYVSVRQFLLLNRLELGKLVISSANQNAKIPELLNNANSRIGVIGGTSYVGFLQEDFPKAQKVEFGGWSDMLAAVKSGEIVALMYDEIEIGNWRLADPAGSVELRPFHLSGHPDTIAIAVGPEDPELRDWINLYLAKIRDNGSLDAILKKYLYTTDRLLTND